MTCVLLEKHLCFFFHPKFMFLGAISGLFSAGCWASTESQDFMVMFYSLNGSSLSVVNKLMRLDLTLALKDRVQILWLSCKWQMEKLPRSGVSFP